MGSVERDEPREKGSRASGPILRLSEIVKTYSSGAGETRVLDGIDFELQRSEFVAIKGPSGAGKTTLLHLAAGLDTPTSGTVTIDGADLAQLDESQMLRLRREQIGFVFQFFNLVPGLDVRDNVALPLLFDGTPRKIAAERASELIGAVGMSHRASHLVGGLSGGEMQRTAVARALVSGPDIVFADEPTGNLDSHTGIVVLDLLAQVCADRDTAILMVTHDDRAAVRADRIVEVRDGRIQNGTVDEAAADWLDSTEPAPSSV